jgi:plasmid stabilization system protein ParE
VTFTVIVRAAAQLDFYEARDHYAGISTDLGRRFQDDFEATAVGLVDFPERFRAVYRDVRRVASGAFPYLIYYRVVKGTVWIIAVRHGASDPDATTKQLRERR